MFWTFITLVGLAAVFVKLGAYSVWMVIFKGLFSFIGVALSIALLVFLIRKAKS
jgi:hypothetical protein